MDTIKYDLKALLERLLNEQPSIERIHVFGSRAYGTGSTRSDCDLLIEFDQSKNLKPSDLREFSLSHCAALDFFGVVGGRATSCSNDSFVVADSVDELILKLDAKTVWNKHDGFHKSPFNSTSWEFETRSFVEFVPTNLPDGHTSEMSWQTIKKRAAKNSLPILPYIGDTIEDATSAVADVARRNDTATIGS